MWVFKNKVICKKVVSKGCCKESKQIIAIVFKINVVLSVCGVCVLYVDAMTGLVMESRDDDVSAIYLDDVNIMNL